MKFIRIAFALFMAAASPSRAEEGTMPVPPNNPLNKGREASFVDPHAMVHDGRVYLFAGHDFSADSKYYTMKDWWVWSSADLINWKMESVLKPEATFIRQPFDGCWAGFGVERQGKWYWYFSAGPDNIGVVTADSPAGPWKDPLGVPLIPKGMYPTMARDCDIFMDDDGKAYMVFGAHKYFIVRLGDDMVSQGEPARRLDIKNSFGPFGSGMTDDKPSLHKHNGLYYLSWSSFYAVSKNVYGPYEYKGTVIDAAHVAPEFLGKRGRLFFDRHGNFFEYNNQWYYVANDLSQPGRNPYYRESIMAYVHYRDNGNIAPVRIDSLGVGQYDATNPSIEAEDYFKGVRAEKRDCPLGGSEMRLTGVSELYYPNIHNVPANATLTLSLASASTAGGAIEVREGTPQGPLLGTCKILKTGKWDKYGTVSCRLNNKAGTLNLCLVATGGQEELCRLDWLSFAQSGK